MCQLGVTHAAGKCVANSAPLHDCEGKSGGVCPPNTLRRSGREHGDPAAPHIMTARPAALLALLLLAMVASSAAERAGDPDGEGGGGGAPFRRGTKSHQLRLSGRFFPGRTSSGVKLPQASSACCGMAANHKTALRAAAVKHTRGTAQQAPLMHAMPPLSARLVAAASCRHALLIVVPGCNSTSLWLVALVCVLACSSNAPAACHPCVQLMTWAGSSVTVRFAGSDEVSVGIDGRMSSVPAADRWVAQARSDAPSVVFQASDKGSLGMRAHMKLEELPRAGFCVKRHATAQQGAAPS